MKKKPKSITFSQAAAELCVSDSTILRLVQRGTLHTTKPVLRNGHWARRIVLDEAYYNEKHRRKNGLKAPRRKTIPTDVTKEDPNPTQTVTPAEGILEKARNAMNICLETQKDCQSIKDSITRYQHEVDSWAMEKVRTIKTSELTCTRCTAILAAACILQLILAAYYTLCHFNII